MNNKHQKLATDLGITRTLPDAVSGEQARKPSDHVHLNEVVNRMNDFFDDFTDAFKRSLKVHGIEIGNVQIFWRPIDTKAVETLARTRLVPEVNVGAVKLADEVPSFLEGNLCQ